ncbi:Peptidase family M50 [Aquisphaera giovannonii]|uniref:Peptidase family M50 n=1 Tax=Aquisphaera giovannonii TaxID=406548 RepID=A0A5B9W8T6_9BACT|nr:site-2 protease family protein [Aquisphaera giovannonii]QEH37052.1 Peptidase family M50 [Aquisphaera giovannonii]
MLGTNATAYDLRFRFLDIPVRIHPLFWMVTAFMGWQDHNMPFVALWILCVLVSILVHEYGHGLMARHFGGSPSIVLYGLGGLCISPAERTPAQRLAVLFSGPGAGFVLLGLVMVITTAIWGITPYEHVAMMRYTLGLGGDEESVLRAFFRIPNVPLRLCYDFLVQINLFWGLVNLLPIYPLDGGQATQVVMSQLDRRHGARRSHIVSFVTAGVLAVGSFVYTRMMHNRDDYFLLIFFGMLALLNYQMLQAYHVAHSYGLDSSDDYWRR